jgi:putative acetyltransferase
MKLSNIVIRDEAAEDHRAVYQVNRLAFGRTEEADLVERVSELDETLISLVALSEDELIGHILFSPVTVHSNPGSISTMGLGPVAVLPAFQKRGIGSALIDRGLLRCKEAGCGIAFVLGHPDYYPRFGFSPAVESGFFYRNRDFDPYFFHLELEPGTAEQLSGEVQYLSPFDES